MLKEAEGEEVARRERYTARPSLEGIYEAIYRRGYKLKEVGKFLGVHYPTLNRIASRIAKSKT